MNLSFLPEEFVVTVVLVSWAATVVIHICFALAVRRDAANLSAGREPIFVGPGIWFLATLFGGVFVASAYWVIHHSRLNEAVTVTNRET